VGVLLVSVNVLSAIWDLRNSRAVVQRDAERGYGNIATLLADQTAGSLESIELIVEQTAGDISRNGVGDPRLRSQRLADRIAGLPRIRDLVILDRQGQLVLRTVATPTSTSDLSDREYFSRHRDEPRAGILVSEPFVSRISGKWSFALSERLTGEGGAFAGVVAAIVDVEYFERLFRSVDMAGSGFVFLFTAGGVPVTGVPPLPPGLQGKPYGDAPALLEGIRERGRYTGWITDPEAPGQMLVAARQVGSTRFAVGVGAHEGEVLAPWHAEVQRVMVRTLLTSAFMLLLVWVASRELTRRENAEQAARAERERLEQRLRQGEKMEAIGRLSGGIAHDFNNILGGIMGYAEMLLEDLPEGSPHQAYARHLLAASQRARQLVEQILTYSRTAKVPRQPIELGKIVRETLDVMRGSVGDGIRIEGAIPALPAVTIGDATQLHEVVMNLCTNAVQAMGDHGTLTVRLDAVDASEALALSHGTLEPGPYLKLTVADTGVGMDDETLAHIFEPFFTTKEVGGGTGLGLAIVYGIVSDSNGAISVSTRKGEGTRFEIYLPRADKATPVTATRSTKERERGAGERILLVDDEAALLEMMAVLLRRLGYRPTQFSNPHQALAAFEADPAAYDLVLTDEAMPGLPGTALARGVRNARPDIPVLMITGRAEEPMIRAASEAGVAEVLLKPIESRELAAAIARHIPSRTSAR
jgi:signal transduction histidine kinase/ActR/RegA family two-component response regulator